MRPLLVLVLEKELKGFIFHAQDSEEASELKIGSRVYSFSDDGFFMGFHDWLRNPETGKISGIDWWPSCKSYLENIKKPEARYVRLIDGIGARFSFGDNFEIVLSSDENQDFVMNRMVVSEDNQTCLVFDTESLSSEELKELSLLLVEPNESFQPKTDSSPGE